MSEFADLQRRIESMIRTGTVMDVQHGMPPRCRVKSGKLETDWLPWVTLRAGNTLTWDPVTVGEQCLLICPSGEPDKGIVLPALYSDGKQAPGNSPDEHITKYPDGAIVKYNHASSTLSVTGIKYALVEASEDVTVRNCKTANVIASVLVKVDCPESEFTGNVTIDGNLHVKGTALIDMLLTYMSGMSGYPGVGDSAAGSTIRGPINQEEGDFHSTGDIKTDSDVLAGDISLRHHEHDEHGTGGGVTGEAHP